MTQPMDDSFHPQPKSKFGYLFGYFIVFIGPTVMCFCFLIFLTELIFMDPDLSLKSLDQS